MNKKFLVCLVILGVAALFSMGALAEQLVLIPDIVLQPATVINSGILQIDTGKPAIKEITVDSCIVDGDKIATLDITSKISYDDSIYAIMGSVAKKTTNNNSVKYIKGKDCTNVPGNGDVQFKCTFNIDDMIYSNDKILINVIYKLSDVKMRGYIVTKELNAGNIKGCSDASIFIGQRGGEVIEGNWDDEPAVAETPPATDNNASQATDGGGSSSDADDDAGVLVTDSLDPPVEDDGGCSLVTTATAMSVMPLLLSLLPAALVALRRKF